MIFKSLIIYPKFLYTICIFFVVLNNCTNVTTAPQQDTQFCYQVHIPSMPADTIAITLVMTDLLPGKSQSLFLPPVYADNPFPKQSGKNVHSISLTDTFGTSIVYNLSHDNVGIYCCSTLTFTPFFSHAILNYSVTFNYVHDSALAGNIHMPLPFVAENSGYIQGTYLFAIPFETPILPELWRHQQSIRVAYDLGDNIACLGEPNINARYRNNYELLFATNALIKRNLSDLILFDNQEAGGQKYQLVSVFKNNIYPTNGIELIQNNFASILKELVPIFPPLDTMITIITGFNDKIGLEGMNSFVIFNPKADDDPKDGGIRGYTAMTLAHELIHSWVGIRVGEYDAPWWKEGTTSYLGYLVAKRLNLCTQELFDRGVKNIIIEAHHLQPQYALSSEYMRENIFFDSHAGYVIYRKGSQVSLLLDRIIREASNNNKTLLTLIGNFCKKYNGDSFYCSEYLDFLSKHSGADRIELDSIRIKYIDKPDSIPRFITDECIEYLSDIGALGNYTFTP